MTCPLQIMSMICEKIIAARNKNNVKSKNGDVNKNGKKRENLNRRR